MSIPTTTTLRNFVWQDATIGASFSVTFPKTPLFELICIGLEITQSMAEHDTVVLHLKGKPFRIDTSIVYNDPVVIEYKNLKHTSTFHGYVHRIKQTSTIQGTNETTIECIAASSVLKETDQNIYTEVTADQVVSRVCTKFDLSANVQRDPRVRQDVVQAGQSFWQLFRSLALQTGYALRAENTTVTFCSRDKITSSKKSYAPYYLYVDNELGGGITKEQRALGTITYFHPIISDGAPESGVAVDRVISGKAKNNNQTVKITNKRKVKAVDKGAATPSEEYFS